MDSRAADRGAPAPSGVRDVPDRLAPVPAGASAPDDALAGVLARAVSERSPTALLQRAMVTYRDFANSRVATSHQTVHNLRGGDERYWFGDYGYDVHFHGNGWRSTDQELTSFTGTFLNKWRDVRHITLIEYGDRVWIAKPDRACDGWDYLDDALDATYERLGWLIGIPSQDIERKQRPKAGAYVPPHLR
jgi:hypothetical protein